MQVPVVEGGGAGGVLLFCPEKGSPAFFFALKRAVVFALVGASLYFPFSFGTVSSAGWPPGDLFLCPALSVAYPGFFYVSLVSGWGEDTPLWSACLLVRFELFRFCSVLFYRRMDGWGESSVCCV